MPSISKRVLGRGLSDLIPTGGDEESNSFAADVAVRTLPVSQLHRSPNQPRTHFDEAALAELTDSIKLNGVLQPILVRPRASGGYEIVAGERRYRAGLRAGLTDIPVVVRTLSDAETLAVALIENLIREDIGPLEAARAFNRLMEQYGWTQEEMGRRVGKSRSAVANSLRLLTLPDKIQQSIERGELSEGLARALIGDERIRQSSKFATLQESVWKQAVERGLSVRDAERLMREGNAKHERTDVLVPSAGSLDAASGTGSQTAADPIELRAIEDRFRSALGMRVRLAGGSDRGRIEIEFFSADELDGLLARFEAGSR